MRSNRARPARYVIANAIAVAWFTVVVSPATAQLVNGDFATGDQSGWMNSAIDSAFGSIDADPYIQVVGLGSGNAASFSTGGFTDGLFLASLHQSFTIQSDNPVLTFDFSIPEFSADSTGAGDSPVSDAMFVLIDNSPTLFDLLVVDQDGALPDPFSSAPGTIVLGPPSDDAFDFSLRADLSALAGQNVTLAFDIMQEDDGMQIHSIAIGNAQLVPEPSSPWLVALALSTIFLKWRRRRVS